MTDRHNSPHVVTHYRHILLWLLRLMPLSDGDETPYWKMFEQTAGSGTWEHMVEKYSADVAGFKERHYREFTSFLPYVQRFIYGEGKQKRQNTEEFRGSAFKVFRRRDIASARVTLHAGDEPVLLSVINTHLRFFDDADIVMLKMEVAADNLPLDTVLDLLYHFGRAYPTTWDKDGQVIHNCHKIEWLAADGNVLAVSDAENRDKFLSFTRDHRVANVSSHWSYLVHPLVLDPSDAEGRLRYRQIEHHRMPMMALLAIDDPCSLERKDWLRIGMVSIRYLNEVMPGDDPNLREFESRYCYDRYWMNNAEGPNTRFLCSGNALIVVGNSRDPYFLDNNHGILAQFRYPLALLFMIAHFQRGTLLTFSELLVDAVNDLDIHDSKSASCFRQRIYTTFESFLRFTHRYWVHELSESPHLQSLYQITSQHLNNEALYAELKEELRDMSYYLDSDAQRRQSATIVRLTVVTTFSLVGTVATGFLGMNIVAEADAPILIRWSYFLLVVIGTGLLTMMAVASSQRLSEIMDILADEKLCLKAKMSAVFRGKNRKASPGEKKAGR